MASIDDPAVWAKIIQHVLDTQICNYASLMGVCRLFSRLAKEYMEREIHLPQEMTVHPVVMQSITFRDKDQFVLQLETPSQRDQSQFQFTIAGRYPYAQVFKYKYSVDSICRAALYPWELVKFYDALRDEITFSIAEYWRQIENGQLRPAFILRYKSAKAKAEQRASEKFQRWKRINKRVYRRINPDRSNFDLFSEVEFCLASSMPNGF